MDINLIYITNFIIGYLSLEEAVIKAIQLLSKSSVFPSIDKHDNPVTASSSAMIRKRFHPLGHQASLHSVARSKFEKILIYVLGLIDPRFKDQLLKKLLDFKDEEMDMMLDFAECIDSTSMFDCSVSTVDKFRSADGTCNNLLNSLQGASNTAFRRLLPAVYEDGILVPVGHNQQVNGNPFAGPWPSARRVSELVVRDIPKVSMGLSHIFMLWGQFIDHDFDLTAEFETSICEETCEFEDTCPFCYPITVSQNDQVFGIRGPNKGMCLPLTRSVGTCMRPSNSTYDIARQQINQLTHYQDASNVYGSTQEVAESLRLFSGGLLREGGRTNTLKGNLPFGDELSDGNVPFFVGGDVRANEHVALIVMHTIWLREHNRIVRELAELNPCWDDERLYQEGRKIVGAMMQVITYDEFLPLLFGEEAFNTFIGSYTGYDPYTDVSIPNSFAAAAFRFGHSLVNPMFARLDEHYNALPIGPLGLREAFFNPIQYFVSGGTDPLLRGLLHDRSRELDEFVNRVMTTQLFAPNDMNVGQDLVSRNIQRAREHGIPSYRAFQQSCFRKFSIPSRFANRRTESKLRYVYGRQGFKDGIDLFVGGLAEDKVEGSNLGPTFACIIGQAFANIRNGDRFYVENPGVFTDDQLNSLHHIRLSKVICNNADSIDAIIPRAFETGQQRQYCSDLPNVDLSLWKDDCDNDH